MITLLVLCWRLTFMLIYDMCIKAKPRPQPRGGPWPRSASWWWMRRDKLLIWQSCTVTATVTSPHYGNTSHSWTLQTQVLLPVRTLNEEVTAVTDKSELINYGCVSFRWSGRCVSLRDSNRTLAGTVFKSDYIFQKTLIEADCLKSFEAAFPGTLGARRPCRITQIPFAAPCPQFHLSSTQE